MLARVSHKHTTGWSQKTIRFHMLATLVTQGFGWIIIFKNEPEKTNQNKVSLCCVSALTLYRFPFSFHFSMNNKLQWWAIGESELMWSVRFYKAVMLFYVRYVDDKCVLTLFYSCHSIVLPNVLWFVQITCIQIKNNTYFLRDDFKHYLWECLVCKAVFFF